MLCFTVAPVIYMEMIFPGVSDPLFSGVVTVDSDDSFRSAFSVCVSVVFLKKSPEYSS